MNFIYLFILSLKYVFRPFSLVKWVSIFHNGRDGVFFAVSFPGGLPTSLFSLRKKQSMLQEHSMVFTSHQDQRPGSPPVGRPHPSSSQAGYARLQTLHRLLFLYAGQSVQEREECELFLEVCFYYSLWLRRWQGFNERERDMYYTINVVHHHLMAVK